VEASEALRIGIYRHARTVGAALVAPLFFASYSATAQTVDELRAMSIEDLADVSVSSVSKTDQPLADAPAAIYVINRETILRSGAATLPEILRLAPNLQVYQINPGEWMITARGFNGNLEAQSFPNKLLVLIDGRPIYTPLFSGVYWDLPDVLPENIDRIEVISGPGATLWGANAVNGVINIIKRRSSEMGGFYADARVGPDRQAIGARVSGQVGENLSYRLHGKYVRDEAFLTVGGLDAQDGRRRIGGGIRLDWSPNDRDTVALNGELFSTRLNQPGGAKEQSSGRNVTVRWNRQLSVDSELQAQVFYDRVSRDDRAGGGVRFHADTFDAEVQHAFAVDDRHRIVLGGGARLFAYDIEGTPSIFFEPGKNTLLIANAFVQDNFAISSDLTLTAGIKIEKLPYAGAALLPELRLAWKATPSTLIWGSIARAVRSPTPFDVDVEERVANIISISGDPNFRTEKLTAFELGTRLQPATSFSLSATAFYHRYDDLRSIEFAQGPAVIALGWGNGLSAETYGIESWADFRANDWWTLAVGATWQDRTARFDPESSGLFGPGQLGTDPPYWITARSSMNLGSHVQFDLDFRAVGALGGSDVPAYEQLGGRVAWQATPGLTFSVSGTNLLEAYHREYPQGDLIPRRFMGGVELRF
jgi:iron complex outermembrane receptor protein